MIKTLQTPVITTRYNPAEVHVAYFDGNNPIRGLSPLFTEVYRCELNQGEHVTVYYNPRTVEERGALGLVGIACQQCKFKPGNEVGGCKAYYQARK